MNGAVRWRAILLGVLLSFPLPGLRAAEPLPHARVSDRVKTNLMGHASHGVLTIRHQPLLDPSLDDPAGPFSYFVKPSQQLGLPGRVTAPEVTRPAGLTDMIRNRSENVFATQVTPEGRLYTGAAELIFFAGGPLQPINQRIRALRHGYLPCVQMEVERDGIRFQIETFQFWLGEEMNSPPVNFIRVLAQNQGSQEAESRFAVGFSFGGGDHRPPQMIQEKFSGRWAYEMKESAAWRDGKIIYAWGTNPSLKLARLDQTFSEPFHNRQPDRPVCLAVYALSLKPGGQARLVFKMPHFPLEPARQEELIAAGFDERLARFESYWDKLLAQGASLSLPEAKVADASQSYRVHNLMTMNILSDNEIEQHVNRFQYNRFWLRDGAFFARMFDLWGFHDIAEKELRHFLKYQDATGNFLSQKGQLDGFGQALWALGEHVRLTGDADFAREVFPAVERAVSWFEQASAEDKWGLMPATNALDNEMIIGHYTGHNFWALMGLAGAKEVARAAGEEEAAERFQKVRDDFAAHFLPLLRRVAKEREGLIPPAMDVKGGIDWGNLLAVYPGGILDPFDPLVTATFTHYREKHMAEGLATYNVTMHHYLTERVAETALIRGEQEQALRDLYAMLLHTGSCHEGFEWTVYPWDGRDYCYAPFGVQVCNFTPHGWYAALLNTLLRNMLVREEGETLHLLSALSPEWTKPGDVIRFENAPTYFGPVGLEVVSSEQGAVIRFQPEFRRRPEKILVHLPFYVTATEVLVNGRPVEIQNRVIPIGPETSEISVRWERDPSVQMSYQKAVENYLAEYRRRWEQN